MDDLDQPELPVEADVRASAPPVMESMGPIQMLTLAFPGNQFKGEILPELERLKKEGIIRIVDLLMVRKDGSGT